MIPWSSEVQFYFGSRQRGPLCSLGEAVELYRLLSKERRLYAYAGGVFPPFQIGNELVQHQIGQRDLEALMVIKLESDIQGHSDTRPF